MRHRFGLDGRGERSGIAGFNGTGWGWVLALLLTACVLTSATGVLAQEQHGGAQGAPQTARGADGTAASDVPQTNPVLLEQMAGHRNSERQRELVADTDKLLRLAQQLHDEVAKSNKDQLSVSVVKTSGEIEKLAKSVKEKMRGY